MLQEGAFIAQTIAFNGDEIVAVQDPETLRVYVPINRLCDNLGLDRASQSERIQDHDVLRTGFLTLRIQTPGGIQETQCLRLDLLPFWLAGINAKRVKPAIREKLIVYQRDCAAVLWDAFRPSGQPSSVALEAGTTDLTQAEQAYELALALANLARQQMRYEAQLTELAQQVTAQAERIAALEVTLAPRHAITAAQAAELSQAIKLVARELGNRTGRNEYGGIYGQLYREFGIVSYRELPAQRFEQAMQWLHAWHLAIEHGILEAPRRTPE